MTRHDDLRLLDPVDREAPAPDGEALLREILAVPLPVAELQRRPRPRVPRVRLGVVGAVALAAAAFVFAVPRGGEGDVLAAAFRNVHQPGTILHYTRVMHRPGPLPGVPLEMEVWQAADGSRQRVLTKAPGLGVHEAVVDGRRSETYVGDSDQIIVYEEKAPKPEPPGAVGAPAMGDPRTLLERARRSRDTVEELEPGRVRGVDVLRFRVGECRARIDRGGSGAGNSIAYESPLIVSIARDGFMPVRVEQPGCRAEHADGSPPTEVPEGMTIDYVGLEVLPATRANERQLEMSPHPGAAVLDGEDIDAEEERAEAPVRPRPRSEDATAGSRRRAPR